MYEQTSEAGGRGSTAMPGPAPSNQIPSKALACSTVRRSPRAADRGLSVRKISTCPRRGSAQRNLIQPPGSWLIDNGPGGSIGRRGIAETTTPRDGTRRPSDQR